MSETNFRNLTGIFFIVGALLVNAPYTLIIGNFDYPEILRQPTAEILTKFHAGGDSLIYTWLALTWVGLPILFGTVMLKRVLKKEGSSFLEMATTLGVIGYIVQVIGLLRWVFVVPVLARIYTNPTSDPATQAPISAVFIAIHQYGGVVLCEHIGQFLTIAWMSIISGIIYKSRINIKWLPGSGDSPLLSISCHKPSCSPRQFQISLS